MSAPESRDADALEARLSADDRDLLDKLADWLVRYRLASAALFFFELSKPWSFRNATTMVMLRPIIETIWAEPKRWDIVTRLLEERGGIELLLRRLEARA